MSNLKDYRTVDEMFSSLEESLRRMGRLWRAFALACLLLGFLLGFLVGRVL